MASDPIASLRVSPGKNFSLKHHDTGATLGWHKESAR